MREIKFRAWHKGNWHEKKHHWIHEPQMIYDDDPGDCLYFVKQRQNIEDVMQYTGLKDSKGKEIYEGDILQSNTGRQCKVVWHCSELHCGWDLTAINSTGYPPYRDIWDATRNGWEVIDNIYEGRGENVSN